MNTDAIKELKDWAVQHYEEGAHWVVETWDSVDYLQALAEGGSVEGAKVIIKEYWMLICDMERECAWSGPES